MHEYLKFPTKNYVGKSLNKERYINSANLTNAERKCLTVYLNSINILYSFPFDDGEIVVLLADYSSVEHHKFALNNFVKAVAQSLPYRILLIVRFEGVIRFFSFYEKENTVDGRRMRVRDVVSSSDIIPLANNIFDKILIKSLRTAAVESTSAQELYQRWNSSLSPVGDNSIVKDTFCYSIEDYYALAKRKKLFDELTDETFCDYFDTDCFLYDGTSLDMEDEIDQRFFVEFCAFYARVLFNEVSDTYYITKNEWLKIYIDGCNSFAKNIFKRVLGNKCVKIISNAFWNGNDDYLEAADCYDVHELKEEIGYYYFDEE